MSKEARTRENESRKDGSSQTAAETCTLSTVSSTVPPIPPHVSLSLSLARSLSQSVTEVGKQARVPVINEQLGTQELPSLSLLSPGGGSQLVIEQQDMSDHALDSLPHTLASPSLLVS